VEARSALPSQPTVGVGQRCLTCDFHTANAIIFMWQNPLDDWFVAIYHQDLDKMKEIVKVPPPGAPARHNGPLNCPRCGFRRRF
jgi:hypothetical protein